MSGKWLEIDPQAGPLEILQVEKLGKWKWGHVEFLDAAGEDAGGFSVEIGRYPVFSIKGCSTTWDTLKEPLPDAEMRVWKFEKDLGNNQLIVSVNGTEIHRVNITACPLPQAKTIYSRTITLAMFGQTYNDAFQFYRQQPSNKFNHIYNDPFLLQIIISKSTYPFQE